MSSPAAILVTITATRTDEYLPSNRLAVAPAAFSLLCRDSAACGGNLGTPDELHITAGDDDLDALDDLLRDRAQTLGAFVGGECVVLLPKQGTDGCDVWARCRVVEMAETVTV
jgi:hypothetical protein